MQNIALSNREKVATLLSSFGSGIKTPLSYVHPDRYISHNHGIGDGLQGLKMRLKEIPRNAVVRVRRLMEDGAFVFAHVEYCFDTPQVGFEIFRFEDGKIVEHWDNLQPLLPQVSGRNSMTGGTVMISDRRKTEDNKAFVSTFADDILLKGNLEKLADYFDREICIHHSPWCAGKADALTKWEEHGTAMKYDKIHKILGEGNFVLVVSEGHFKDAPAAFYDLFRIENGRIAEHWDTIEEIVTTDNYKNINGKF